jgi:hypothetical protein
MFLLERLIPAIIVVIGVKTEPYGREPFGDAPCEPSERSAFSIVTAVHVFRASQAIAASIREP